MGANNKIFECLSKVILQQYRNDELGPLKTYMETCERYKKEPDQRSIGGFIAEEYPVIIERELKKLFSMEDEKERFVFSFIIAETCAQLLCYILLSQLWQERRTNKIKVSLESFADYKTNMKIFDKLMFGNKAGLIRGIHEIFRELNITPFTGQFTNPCFDAGDFDRVLNDLVNYRNKYHHEHLKIDDMVFTTVEDLLITLLIQLSFLVKFELLSVSKIEIFTSMLSPDIIYNHEYRNPKNENGIKTPERKDFTQHCHSHSVLLVRDPEMPERTLNLSPFVIDPMVIMKRNNEKMRGIKEGIYIFNPSNVFTKNNTFEYHHSEDYDKSIFNAKEGAQTVYSRLVLEFTNFKNSLAC